MMATELIRNFVRESRAKTHLTQKELANKSGVGLRFIRDLEQGKETLRTDTLSKLLRFFGKQLGPVDLPREE